MFKKIFYLSFITISFLVSSIYLTGGCGVFKPSPTPTLIPTATALPTATATPEPTKDPKAFLIIPGKGIADLQINKSTLEEVKKFLGEPDGNPTTEQGHIKINYEKQKLTFWFEPKKNILKSIMIESDSYKTAEGIGVGASLLDIQKIYKDGTLDKDKKIYYSNDGMDYYYDAGNINSILLSDRSPVVQQSNSSSMSGSNTASIPKEYLSSAQEAVETLEALDSAIDTGLSNELYKNRVVDAQIVIDKFINNNPTEYIKELKSYIYWAMICYKDFGLLHDENAGEATLETVYKDYPDLKSRIPNKDIPSIARVVALGLVRKDAGEYTKKARILFNEAMK